MERALASDSPNAALCLLHQILDSSGHLFHRHFRIDTVLIQEVDMVSMQAFQRALHRPTNMIGTAIDSSRLFLLDTEAELRSYFHFVAKRSECFADPLFAGVRAINLRRIEKSDTFVVCPGESERSYPFVVLPTVISHHWQTTQTNS